MHQLEARQHVRANRETVFRFFQRPENLATLSPPWLKFGILTPPPIPMREGAVIDYRIGLGPLPTRWRTMITTFEPPHLFVDEQLLGPYDFWHHTHRFEESGGGTLLRDEVRYLLPFGPLGNLVHAAGIRRQLSRIFRYRQRCIAERFGNVEDRSPVLEFS